MHEKIADSRQLLTEQWLVETQYANDAERALEEKMRHFEDHKKLLQIDAKHVNRRQRLERLRNMSRVGFFIVLLSCELSITSYCMVGLPGLVLWKAAVGDFAATVHCLLAAAPLAYIIAICSHWYSASQSASDSTPDRKSRLSRLLPTSETKMELEHVVPGMRLHLAVKSISADDVDAMFKIHRLIFVAFGVGQALALLMLHFQSGTYKRADGTEGVVQALTWKMWKLEWSEDATFGLALLI
jgi:hypothetical protein